MMSPLRAIGAGFTRMLRHPFVVIGLWLLNALVAAPAALLMTASLSRSMGKSRVHEKLRDGFDMGWFGEYQTQASGIERSFDPSITGVGAFLDNLVGWLTGDLFRSGFALVALGAVYAFAWAMLLGGVIARYAGAGSGRGVRAFFRDGLRHAFRFVRLALMSTGLYVLIYLFSKAMFERVDRALRDVTAETSAVALSLVAWAVTAALLVLVHMVFDYAKIATVVERRHSMILAALRGAGFVLLNPLRTAGVYAGVLFVGGLVVGLYAVVAPGVSQSTRSAVIVAFAVGQLFIVTRLALRLTLLAGQTALFRAVTEVAVPVESAAPASDHENSSV